MYFKKFDRVLYNYGYDDKGIEQYALMVDISRNVRFRKEVLANITLYEHYDMREGETPELVAEKFYGNSQYHWVVMLVNERFDYVKDFPLPQKTLVKYVEDTYGVDNVYDTHHYENDKGFTVDSDYPGAYPVSNMEYEERRNEAKRKIKIISRDLLSKILNQFNDIV